MCVRVFNGKTRGCITVQERVYAMRFDRFFQACSIVVLLKLDDYGESTLEYIVTTSVCIFNYRFFQLVNKKFIPSRACIA